MHWYTRVLGVVISRASGRAQQAELEQSAEWKCQMQLGPLQALKVLAQASA